MKKLFISTLSLCMFLGLQAYSQNSANTPESTASQAARDKEAFDAYFARRAAATVVKDSVEALTPRILKPNGANANPQIPEKVYSAGLKAEQETENNPEPSVIPLPSTAGKNEKNSSGQRR